MSVRLSLLAILDQGPCYGYQLRAEFERRTGSTWMLNVGQIYNTLDRLERDGLVAKDEPDSEGHVFWRITDDGSAAVREWLASPVPTSDGTRDEVVVKLTIAATLPGVDAAASLRAQRSATLARLEGLRAARATDGYGSGEDLARALVDDAALLSAEAELRWLDLAAERLARHPDSALGLALSAERPRRGRPSRV